ncbi:MAG: FtsW/RodA/SpoVE family cell cycle protein [Clostridium sp.]|nr:FtsW/RodA/SpoVE family cell cycle protein [Clostridium sp.]
MDKKIDKFLSSVCNYIKNKEVHKEVYEELKSHIYEIVEEYEESGLTEEEAINKAIERMGKPNDIGEKLNKVHKPKIDWINIGLITIMMLIGLGINLSLNSYQLSGEVFYRKFFLYKKIKELFIETLVVISLYFFDYRKLQKHSYKIYIFSIGILTLNLIDRNNKINEFILSIFENSDIVSIIIPILLISIVGIIFLEFNEISEKIIFDKCKFIKIIAILIAPIILIGATEQMGKLLLYFLVINVILICSNLKKKYKINVVLMETIIFVISFVKIVILSSYRRMSLFGFLRPEKYIESSGNFYLNIKESIKSLSLFGEKFNQSDYLYYNMIDNDLIINYILKSFGIIGFIFIAFFILFFLIRNFKNIFKVKDSYGKFLVICIFSIFTIEFIMSILFNFGLSPISYGLPFISQGKGNIIIIMVMTGLMLSVYRRKNIVLF